MGVPTKVVEAVRKKSDEQLWAQVKEAHQVHQRAKKTLDARRDALEEAQQEEHKARSARARATRELNLRLQGKA